MRKHSLFKCSARDIAKAFVASTRGVRVRMERYDETNFMDIAKAQAIADRLHESRELIRQLLRLKRYRHVRRLMRFHRRQRNQFIAHAKRAGIDISLFNFR